MKRLVASSFVFFTALAIIASAADSVTNPTETAFRVRVNVQYLSERCITTPDFQLNHAYWTVQLCNVDGWINATLVSHFAQDAPRWTAKARATIRLLPKSGKADEIIKEKIESQKFSAKKSSAGIEELVAWNRFMEKYVEDGFAVLEFEISTEMPVRIPVSEQISSKSIIIVENVSNFEKLVSREVVLRGVRWSVRFEITNNNYVAGYLQANVEDLTKFESWHVQATFKIIANPGHNPYFNDFEFTYNKIKTFGGMPTFITWDDFNSPSYIDNDKVKFEIEFTVDEPKLD